MKNLYLHLFFGFCFFVAQAQVPQLMNYQAIARNAQGTTITNQPVKMRFTIRNGNNIVYQETDTATTNLFGLFTTQIGGGTPTSGSFSAITWAGGNKTLQVELDAAGGNTFTDMGTTELVSVPYALYAGNATMGATGPTGATGPAGGPAGPTGPTGAAGTNGGSWQTSGNAGENPPTHFIGTLDDNALDFSTDDSTRMVLLANGGLQIGYPTVSGNGNPTNANIQVDVNGNVNLGNASNQTALTLSMANADTSIAAGDLVQVSYDSPNAVIRTMVGDNNFSIGVAINTVATKGPTVTFAIAGAALVNVDPLSPTVHIGDFARNTDLSANPGYAMDDGQIGDIYSLGIFISGVNASGQAWIILKH